MRKSKATSSNSEAKLKELVEAMTTAKNAVLPEQQFLPILSHFCFKNGYVFGYDDSTCIASKCGTDALDGYSIPINIYDFMKSATASVIKIESSKGIITLKVGRASVKFGTFTEDSFLFTPPPIKPIKETKKDMALKLDSEFMEGLKLCTASMTNEAVIANQKGAVITLDEKGSLSIYSTDNITASRYIVGGKHKSKSVQFILPRKFCSLMLIELAKVEVFTLHANAKEAWITLDHMTMYTKLVPMDDARDIEAEVFSKFLAPKSKLNYVDASKKLGSVVDRALAVLGANKKYSQDVIIDIEVGKLKLSLPSSTDGAGFSGKFNEYIKAAFKDNISAAYNADMLKRACLISDEFCFLQSGVAIFSGSNGAFKHIVSSAGNR